MQSKMIRHIAHKAVTIVRTLLLLILFSQIEIYGQDKVKSVNDTLSALKVSLSGTLNVAAVQMRSSGNLTDNIAHIKDFIKKCAVKGARVDV
jgi:hypothetical protein